MTKEQSSSSDAITLRIPKLSLTGNYTPILIGLLLIASFLLGMLTTKVQYLERGITQPNVKAADGGTSQGAQSQQQPKAQQPTGKIKPVANTDHIRGSANAKLTLVEYSDIECPFCKRFHPTMQEILKTYGDKVRWVYRHYPLAFHANAQKEAEASECVAELGGNDKFWIFVDKLFEQTTSNGTGFALTALGPLAAQVGVNQTQFQSCLDGGKYTQLVKDQITDGTTGGVTGTPSTFIVDTKGNSQIIVGAQPIESVKASIDQALSK